MNTDVSANEIIEYEQTENGELENENIESGNNAGFDIGSNDVNANNTDTTVTVSGNTVSVSGSDLADTGYSDVLQGETKNESALSMEILVNQQELITSVNSLNNTLIVILFFIVFTWAEKKIKNSVKKVVSTNE